MRSKNNALRLLILSALFAGPCQAAQQELVWSQSDGLREEIYASSYKNETWSEPVKITDDNANNLHPALAVAPDGRKWTFWSAVNPDGISIEYAVSGNDGRWSEPVKMEMDDLSSAIAPSVLIDKSGTVWVVWAGNNGAQDEIYWSRCANGVWQKPQMINAANQVPDIRPEFLLNEQGQIEVSWEGFRDGKYAHLASVYTEGRWSSEQKIEKKQEEPESEPELPAFVPKGSQYVLLDTGTSAAGVEAAAK
ncbi:hypothetical protein VU07_00385 [Desulfobulbus sp. F4]|nr:hypothetical protein [Desulfobulbus sp. F3]MCW5200265.1 hypothetical protein [Desulfobulbus sp. F4]